MTISDTIRELAYSKGIDALGFTEASAFTGYALNHSKRRDPKLSLPSAKTIIVAGIYIGGATLPAWTNPRYGRTSRLFLSTYFLDVIKPLEPIVDFLKMEGYQAIVCEGSTKEGSVLPLKLAAIRAGLGWQGKHSLLISKKYGTFLALGGIITNADLEHNIKAEANRCKTCNECQKACPLEALDQPYVLNTEKCMSNVLQEEHLPVPVQNVMENRVADCEICQYACPWNRKHIDNPMATNLTHPFQNSIKDWEKFFYLPDLIKLSESRYREKLGHLNTGIPYRVFKRNTLIAMARAEKQMSFIHLGLRAELLKAITAKGYTVPTPIQAKAIPAILDGRDVLARAQTGTGKTDAFALPLVQILSGKKDKGRYLRALVLTPTRELALQVGESIKAYARKVSMRCTVVYGGVRINPQIDRLKRGIDILVATPGRLLDLAGQRHLNLSLIEFLVFDEADRMLDLGFSQEISEVLDLVPVERRTMLFSATYTQQIRNLAGRMLQDPEYIEVTPSHTAAEAVVQKVHLVDRSNKRALLIHLITEENWSRLLVFTRTRHGANKLTEKLAAQGIRAAALHGNKSQSFRTRTLEAFKNGEIRILVATDVAARGLDISNLPYVVNYDMPGIPEDYVHRIGRTGRAGVSGIAVSLVSHDEKRHLQAIEKLLKKKIRVETVDGYTEDSDVPDFVLFRPNSPSSEKKADEEIKAIVAKRNASKQRSKTRNKKTAGSGQISGSASKSRSGRRNEKAGKKHSRSRPRSPQSSQRNKR